MGPEAPALSDVEGSSRLMIQRFAPVPARRRRSRKTA